jgi:lipopolysaccharide/colanic/teichoic acid biosynthesis glycosyltransferase
VSTTDAHALTSVVAKTAPADSAASERVFARESRWAMIACRALDIVGSAVLLVILMPLLLAIAIAIRIDSRGTPLFRQTRLGRHLEPFVICKFRTMRCDAGHDTHRRFVVGLITGDTPQQGTERPFFKIAADARITRVGRFLRKSSLDELPQLWNVLRGQMSLVGPRPPIQYEVDHYPAHWFERFTVKPGITGLWQVSGRSELTLEQMIALDVEYARRRSLWLNVKILVRTVSAVLSGRGAA